MRRIDSSFSLAALAVLVALAACSKAADKAAADAKTPDTTNAVATKAVDTKAPGAKAPDTKTAGANAAASKTAGVKIVAGAPPMDTPAVAVRGGQIDPGMSKAQVVALFGAPASDRVRGDTRYLLFSNGVEQQTGMSDLVVLEGDKVIDAVLRAPNRSYSGTSSSPRAIPSAEAAKAKPPVPPKGGT
jgi:hypothetical protein